MSKNQSLALVLIAQLFDSLKIGNEEGIQILETMLKIGYIYRDKKAKEISELKRMAGN